MRSRSWIFVGGVLAGAAGGWLLAQQRFSYHRRDLFSPRPLRRLAALGYLAGQNGVDTVRLLRDYLAWERQPMLRRRAEAIVRRMEATLV
ncbi:MAG: hypothetical protein ACXWWN_09025 [Gemmatimonadales bacterium]|jgi:hypothetical protein